MIIVSVKAPAPPAKCVCAVTWDVEVQVTTPEQQAVSDIAVYQVTAPEQRAVSDIRLTLEYTIS